MTATGKQVMDQWKDEEKQITVHFQNGEKLTGKAIDYDGTEIVLKCRPEYFHNNKLTETVICRDWMWIELAPRSAYD